ncbi:hypothetical protein ACUUL3_02430 [Thiovibrio sp. JS02]
MTRLQMQGMLIGFRKEKLALPHGHPPTLHQDGPRPHGLSCPFSEETKGAMRQVARWLIRYF